MSRLYDVKWRRPGNPEVLECHGLTAEILVFRIRGVIRMCGSVELLELTPVKEEPGPEPRSYTESEWQEIIKRNVEWVKANVPE